MPEPRLLLLHRVGAAAAQDVRSIIATRSHLVEARVRLDNMIRGICATFGFKPGPGQGKSFIGRVMTAADIPDLGQSITALVAARTGLVEQIRQLDRVLREFAHQSPACRQLMSIPGVGVHASAGFTAAIDQADRFRKPRTAVARKLVAIANALVKARQKWSPQVT